MHPCGAHCADPPHRALHQLGDLNCYRVFLQDSDSAPHFYCVKQWNVHITTSWCTFGQGQGHAGDVIAGAKWEMPTDSCITPDGAICPEAAGCPSAHTGYVLHGSQGLLTSVFPQSGSLQGCFPAP